MDMPGLSQYLNHIVDSNMEALLEATIELQLELQETLLELARILLQREKRAHFAQLCPFQQNTGQFH